MLHPYVCKKYIEQFDLYKQLEHENIVKFYDLFIEKHYFHKHLHIVLEYCEVNVVRK